MTCPGFTPNAPGPVYITGLTEEGDLAFSVSGHQLAIPATEPGARALVRLLMARQHGQAFATEGNPTQGIIDDWLSRHAPTRRLSSVLANFGNDETARLLDEGSF